MKNNNIMSILESMRMIRESQVDEFNPNNNPQGQIAAMAAKGYFKKEKDGSLEWPDGKKVKGKGGEEAKIGDNGRVSGGDSEKKDDKGDEKKEEVKKLFSNKRAGFILKMIDPDEDDDSNEIQNTVRNLASDNGDDGEDELSKSYEKFTKSAEEVKKKRTRDKKEYMGMAKDLQDFSDMFNEKFKKASGEQWDEMNGTNKKIKSMSRVLNQFIEQDEE